MPPGREHADTARWEHHAAQWRNPAQVISGWDAARAVDRALLRHRVRGPFWELLHEADITLLVTREYEHLVMALSSGRRPDISFMPLPHPSGLAVERRRQIVYLASTRNPNQVHELRPVTHSLERADVAVPRLDRQPLVLAATRFYPGALYLHDLALIDGSLHGNAVGQNAVVRLDGDGDAQPVWWPQAVERHGRPDFSRNYLQLNSIAAGRDLASSWFTASADRISARRPGHRNFPVRGRGVLISGATRAPVAGGLTRPHSARLHQRRVWVANSGFGELKVMAGGGFETVARLPGWTRGLCFHGHTAFVGVSRVIPRFRHYAPGLDPERSSCGIFAVDFRTGKTVASLTWPQGNQVFAVEWLSARASRGFPFSVSHRRASHESSRVFYAFRLNGTAAR